MEIIWVLISFLSGSIPFAVVIAKTFKGIDPRKEGSKNPGTTNVARLCGFQYGLLTLVCDILKGTVPVFLSIWFLIKPIMSGCRAPALSPPLSGISNRLSWAFMEAKALQRESGY